VIGGYGPTRWTDADVDGTGVVKLEHIKPGEYRLTRRYRPEAGAEALPAAGRWIGTELPVSLTAGKELPVPPLRWAAGAAPKPVVKPVGKPKGPAR